MLLRITLSLLVLLGPLAGQAQELKGRIVAAASGQPVAFATVGVKGKMLGSTADEGGRFAFAVPIALPTEDSVIITCIGFRSLALTVGQLRSGWIGVDLRPYNIELRHGETIAAGFQWLAGERLNPENGVLSGPAAFPTVGHRVFLRRKSEAAWRSYPMNVSMYLAVQEYR
jgi:hypothetical protein